MNAIQITKIMRHRKAPRIWLQGRVLESAGFTPGCAFSVRHCDRTREVRLIKDVDGRRHVSGKQRPHKVMPILDINTGDVLDVFEGLERIKVVAFPGVLVLLPASTDARKAERLDRLLGRLRRGEPLRVGSLAHGGGMLSKALHSGLSAAGIASELVLASDVDADMLQHASEFNPTWSERTLMLAAPMQELAFDPEALRALPACDILEAGIPCTGASVAGRAKNGTSCPEQHPEVGHLVVSCLVLVAAINPAVFVLENVPPYQSSASMWILRHQLRDLGYVVQETVIDAKQWGVLDCRRRMCMVAVTEGVKFDLQWLSPPAEVARPRVGDIIEPVDLDSPAWSRMSHLLAKAERDSAEGKNFKMQVVDQEATWIRSMGKGYSKNRSTEPKLRHPEDPSLMRTFSAVEHARAKGEDPALLGDLSSTAAHAMLGQGITPPPWIALGHLLGYELKGFAGLLNVDLPRPARPMPCDVDIPEPFQCAVAPRQLSLL